MKSKIHEYRKSNILKNVSKKLFIIALFAIGFTSFAQEGDKQMSKDQMEKMTPEQRTEKQLEKLTSDLNLDAKQQEQIRQVLVEHETKRADFKTKRGERKAKAQKPTSEEREAFKKEMTDNKANMDTKMKSILTPEQFEKWKGNNEKKREKLKERMLEKKGN
jgi:periplasmic protein CpxP/Spy